MAIITDATGRQLAQAVGGIDTTGLVKDSTLQATNTELSNIDTTGQSIASAISGLGTALGSDKANISGDNIASPSTFRTNIGITLQTVTATIPSTAAGSYSTISVNISRSPANVRLIAGFNIYGSTALVPIQLYFDGYNTIQVRLLNHASTAQSGSIQLFYI